jgi:gluconolactonase
MRALVLVAAALALLGCQRPELLVETAEFSEGPVFDSNGNLYFTHGRFVSKLTPGGELSVWLETQGANGHKILADGTHLVCEPGASRILRVDPTGTVTGVASESSDGEPLRAPNDLTLSPEGGFYFTDPGGSRDAPIGTVHYVTPDGVTHTAAGGMNVPNGLALSPDRALLYVAETGRNRVLAFPVEAPGKLGPVREFAALPEGEGVQAEPDGMAVDEAGNLYVAHLGMSVVQVIAPDGTWLRSLPAGNYDVSNLVFGGPDMDHLYVTGSVGSRRDTPGRVYRIAVVKQR